MKTALRALLKYSLAALICCAAFCLALYLAGLGGEAVQNSVRHNVSASVAQFEAETIENDIGRPTVFSRYETSNALDVWTESIILQESMFMDTASDPISVFLNPQRVLVDENGDDNSVLHLQSLREAADGADSTGGYPYYWMGFRSFVRPLLSGMSYPSIRGFLAAVFLLLMGFAALSLYKTCGTGMAAAFLVSTAMANVPVASSLIQYSTCFLLSFAALCLLPLAVSKRWDLPMFFFVIGALTQFFDFYTTPALTLLYPLSALLFMQRRSGRGCGSLCIKTVCAWFGGYGSLWILRLCLCSAILGRNYFASAFGRFAYWTGIAEAAPEGSLTLAVKALSEALLTSWVMLLGLLAALCIVVLLVLKLRRGGLSRPVLAYLPLAALPLVWLALSSGAVAIHAFMEYRVLCGSIFALLAFFVSLLEPAPPVLTPQAAP